MRRVNFIRITRAIKQIRAFQRQHHLNAAQRQAVQTALGALRSLDKSLWVPPAVLTPAEVGDILMVSPITVRQWASMGKLKSHVTPGGHRRFLAEDILAITRRLT